MPDIEYNKSVDFEQKVVSSPHYVLSKILQQTGGSIVAITATSSVVSSFDIPANVYNLSKSFLHFQINLPALQVTVGAVNISCASWADIPPIRRISLKTRGNKYLCDIPNFQHYWKMTSNLVCSSEKFQSSPVGGYMETSALATQNGVVNFHMANNVLPAGAPIGVSACAGGHGAKVDNANTVDNASLNRRAYLSQQTYLTSRITDGTPANSSMVLNCQLNFGEIPMSFFSVNRDFYSSEALVAEIEWESWDNFLFRHAAVATLTTPLTLNAETVPTITDYALYVAIEQNAGIKSAIMEKVLGGGLSFAIPYPTIQRQPLGTATSASVQVRINRGMGSRLLRVISGESLTTDTLSSRCNFYNLAGVKTSNFYTTLDSMRNEAENLDTTVGADWRYLQKLLSGSPFSCQQEFYTQCPVYVNDYSACDSLIESNEKDTLVCGMPLDQEHLWGKILTKSASDTTMTVITVCQKDIVSTAEGVNVI